MKTETVSLITKSMEIDHALESQKPWGLKKTRNLGASCEHSQRAEENLPGESKVKTTARVTRINHS